MGKGRGHIPIRTCVSCRRRHDKKDLIRLYLGQEGMVVTGESESRGAYLCKNQSCMKILINNRKLGRVFKTDRMIAISQELSKELQ